MTSALLLTLALSLPATAAAARVIAPPGNSEADQYYQTVPGATGPRAPDTEKKARDAVRDGALAEATEGALRQRGPRGLALATAVAKTAPAEGVGEGGSPSSPAQAPPGKPGLGAVFPLVLVAAAAAAAAFAFARRRRIVAR